MCLYILEQRTYLIVLRRGSSPATRLGIYNQQIPFNFLNYNNIKKKCEQLYIIIGILIFVSKLFLRQLSK